MTAAPLPPHDPRRRPARPDPRASILAEALRRGKAREAIRALREHTGMGFYQAKDAIEGPAAQRHGDLSPGEVPRRSGLARAVIVLLLLATLAYVWLGGRG